MVLLRHGETPLTAEKRFAARAPARADPDGRAQARAAARAARPGGGVDAIVSSPMRRARQTADLGGRGAGSRRPRVDDGVRESDFGEWEGLTYAEVRSAGPTSSPPGWPTRRRAAGR